MTQYCTVTNTRTPRERATLYRLPTTNGAIGGLSAWD
jgi:hypothetical protein